MQTNPSDENDKSQPQKQEKHKDIKLIVALLTVLYGIQGLIIGIVYETIPLILKAKVSYTQIGLYMLCTYPFSLKILWSPLVDTYYFKSVGKRRTWIIISQFSCCFILFYLYSNIDYYLENIVENLVPLSFLCFFLTFSICSQDIAVDGWALTLLGEKNATTASSCQTFGQIIGVFLTTVVYFYLNSLDFCNKYLYSSPHELPIMNISKLCFYTMILFLIVNFTLILFFTEDFHLDKDELQEEEEICFTETMKRVLKIFKLKGFKTYLGLLIVKNLGMVYFMNVITFVLIDKGLSKTAISMLSTLTIPFQLIFLVKFGKIKENLMQTAMKAQLLSGFLFILDILLIISFDFFDMNVLLLIIFIKSILGSYLFLKNLICNQGFFNKIVDRSLGATYLTLLNSIYNFSSKWPSMLIYPAIDYLGSTTVGVISVIMSFLIYFLTKDKFIELEKKDLKEWKIKKD